MISDERTHFFRLLDGDLEIDGQKKANIRFVTSEAIGKDTHITLISGPNGASKSRMLASIVERLMDLSNRSGKTAPQRQRDWNSHGLEWVDLRTEGSPQMTSRSDLFLPLPSRALAISTIVTDKFPFPSRNVEQEEFYHYLGSRRSSNAVMIGAMGQSIADAIVLLLPKPELFEVFGEWTQMVFGRRCEVAFEYDRISIKQIESYLSVDDKPAMIRERVERRRGAARTKMDAKTVQRITESTTRFFQFLLKHGEEGQTFDAHRSMSKKYILRLPSKELPIATELQEVWETVSDLILAGYSARPNVLVRFDDWVDFNSLSSGEQNILSTGAKLIAYSTPGCLVAIDEPEVSLNVAWQQKYVELVLSALKYAPGSHVLIATHSPHLVANLPSGMASVIVIEKTGQDLKFKTEPAKFEGWGSEAVLYEVLGISSASSFLFNREIAAVLRHIQEDGQDALFIDAFLTKAERIQTSEVEPLEEILEAIREYRNEIA